MQKDDDDGLGDWVLAALHEDILRQTVAYQAEGRRFAALSDDAVRTSWLAAFRLWVADVKDKGAQKDRQDLEAECALRKIAPPYEDVKSEMDALTSQAKGAFAKMSPDVRQEAGRDLLDRVAQLQHERKRAKPS